MEKLKMRSSDLADDNIRKIAALFPNCITEVRDDAGKVKRAVDFDLLRQELSADLVEGPRERYTLTWPGKNQAILAANTPITKTLRPCEEESVNFDTTRNLFIEGDNLDVLKLLQETYLGKVKMIYIDPPYNTGKDFIYKDNFTEDKLTFEKRTGQKDDLGNRLVVNSDSNGRFHSDWLSMMYPRLKLARNLLREDGVICISIDDNEAANLTKLCNEAFGENNFVSILVWEKKKKGTFLSNSITNIKEYILVYAKNKLNFKGLIGEINYAKETYPCINASNKREIRRIPAGIVSKYRNKNYFLPKGSKISVTTMNLILHSDLVIRNGLLAEELVVEGNWRYTQENMKKFALNKKLYITQDLYLRRIVSDPRYKTLKDLLPRVGKDESSFHREININDLFADGWGSNEDGEEELRQLLKAQAVMDFPKPRKLIEKLIISIRDKNAVILDFFSGSATAAHAVLDMNQKDGGNRKFIMVQLPEPCDEISEAFKAGYKTIAEIGKERIRRAGAKIKAELSLKESKDDSQLEIFDKSASALSRAKDLDIGFRVFKTDSSNMKDVYYTPDLTDQGQMDIFTRHIKEGRRPEDLLFQVFLDWGIDLALPIEKKKIKGKTVFFADDNVLAACFDTGITEELVKIIAQRRPLRAVFRDDGFGSDAVKINVEQIFNLLSPGTQVKSV